MVKQFGYGETNAVMVRSTERTELVDGVDGRLVDGRWSVLMPWLPRWFPEVFPDAVHAVLLADCGMGMTCVNLPSANLQVEPFGPRKEYEIRSCSQSRERVKHVNICQ